MVWSRVLRARLSSAAATELRQDESAGVVHGGAAGYAVRPVEASFAFDPTQRVGAVHRRGTGCGPGGVFVERGAEVGPGKPLDRSHSLNALDLKPGP